MEQLLIIKKQQRILFRGHPQKNAEYLGWYHITCRHFKESSLTHFYEKYLVVTRKTCIFALYNGNKHSMPPVTPII